MKASIYLRLSHTAGLEQTGLKTQEHDTRALAERLGLSVMSVHVDDGISGAVRDRPAFLAWLAEANNGRVDALICWHADRLTREGVNAAALILDTVEGKDSRTGKVVRKPVRFLDCKGIDSDGSDAWRFQFVIAAEVARAERQRISERSKRSAQQRRLEGRSTGTAAYGVQSVLDERGLKVHAVKEPEAGHLRDAVALRRAGRSWSTIARELNTRDTGRTWTSYGIRDTLNSEQVRRIVLNAAERRVLDDNVGQGWGHAAGAEKVPKQLLSNLLRCGECGGRMNAGNQTRTRAGERYTFIIYRCPSRQLGRECKAGGTINGARLDAYVTEQFLASEAANLHLDFPTERVTTTDAAEALHAEKDRLWVGVPRLTGEARREAIAAIERLERALDDLPTNITVKSLTEPSGLTAGQMFTAGDTVEKNRLLSQLLAEPVKVYAADPRRRATFDTTRIGVKWVTDSDDV